MCALRLKSNVSMNLSFCLSFLKHVSFLGVGAFACYSMSTTLPLIFLNKNNVNKVVKVVPEHLNWPNIHAIYKNIAFLADIDVYKSY